MSEIVSCVTETKEQQDGVSNESLIQTRVGIQPKINPCPVFYNGGGSLPLQTLNPNLQYSHQLKINGNSLSSVGRNQNGVVFDHGVDQELNLRFTFRKIGAGLENLGNTCFLNSVLQCLTYTEPFTAYLHSGRHTSSCHVAGFCTLCAIEDHVRCAVVSTGRILAPTCLVMNIKRISRNFRRARQEDAHEYMVNLLESMHKCCLPLGLPSASPDSYEKSSVHKIFGGRLRSQVKCMECSYGSNKYDPFLDLSLEIVEADSLLTALANFTAKEQLDEGEKHYQCQQCKQKVMAVRQLTIHEAPNVLTIHLKRFGSLIPGLKLDKRIEFGHTLDLKPFVSGIYEEDLKYTLYGVLVHAGWSTRSGHYYCFVRTSSGKWYYLDDDVVFEVNVEDVLQQKAYMLFYVRDSRNFAPHKPADVLKQSSVVNDAKNRECLDSTLGFKETNQTGMDMLVKGSNYPVSSPIGAKVDAVFSGEVQEFILKNSSNLETNGPLMEDSPMAVDSVESSLQLLNMSSQCPTNNHSHGECLPQPSSLIVECGTIVHLSSSVETKTAEEHEEAEVTKSHIEEQTSPPITCLNVRDDGYVLHLNGSKVKTVNEHEETRGDMTIPLSNYNGSLKCTSRISSECFEHEDSIVIETTQNPAKCENLLQTSTSVVEGNDAISHFDGVSTSSKSKNVNEYEGAKTTKRHTKEEVLPQIASSFVNDGGIVSLPSGPKVDDYEESLLGLPISLSTISDCNVLQKASKISSTHTEHDYIFSNEMVLSEAPSKSLLHTASSVAEGGNTFIETKASDVLEEIETEAIENNIIEQTSPKLASSDKESGGIISHHASPKFLNEHEGTMDVVTIIPVSTSSDSNALDKFALTTSPRKIEHESASVGDMVLINEACQSLTKKNSSIEGLGVGIVSHLICTKITDTSENAETMKKSDVPVATLPNSKVLQEFAHITSKPDLEHQASLDEKVPDSIMTLCEKISDVEPKKESLMFLSSQDTERTAPCKWTDNVGSREIVSSELSDPLAAKDMLLKRIGDLGHQDVGSLPSSSDSRYEEKNGPRSKKIKCVATLTKSKELYELENDHSHFQKKLKPQKNRMKFQIASMNHRSSLLFNRSLCRNRRKKHKKSRKESLLASTSERVNLKSSLPRRRKGNSGTNNTRIDQSGTTLVLPDHSQVNKTSFDDFMSILTRGIEETTVARWIKTGSDIPVSSVGPVADEGNVNCGRGKRKMFSAKSGLVGVKHLQDMTARNTRFRREKIDHCSSADLPFRI